MQKSFVDDTKKKQLLNEYEDLAKHDPRLKKTVFSRVLRHSGNYVANLYTNDQKLSTETFNYWEKEIKPKLTKRINDYQTKTNEELKQFCDTNLSANAEFIMRKLNITKNTLYSTIHQNKLQRNRLLNIYDVLVGNELYPSHKHQTIGKQYPRSVEEVRKEVKELQNSGMTLQGISIIMGITYGQLARYMNGQRLTARRQMEIISLLKKLRIANQKIQEIHVRNLAEAQKQYGISETSVTDIVKALGREGGTNYIHVGGKHEQNRTRELVMIYEYQSHE